MSAKSKPAEYALVNMRQHLRPHFDSRRPARPRRYRLRQTGPDAYALALVKDQNAPPRLDVRASEALHGLYGTRAKVSVGFEDSLPLNGLPKYQHAKSCLPIDIDRYLANRKAL